MKPLPNRVRRQFAEQANAVYPDLSPDFLSADDAARYVHQLIDDRRTTEYGGLILQTEDGKYVATLPVSTQSDEFNPYSVLPVDDSGALSHPPGFVYCALYHSHANDYEAHPAVTDLYDIAALSTRNNFFSPNDVFRNTDLARFMGVHYLSGLNGSLIKYISAGAAQDDALDNVFVRAMFKPTLPEVVTEQIRGAATLGQLSVIQSSEVWRGQLGALGADFELYTPSSYLDITPGIIAHPAFGPLSATVEQAIIDARSRSHLTADCHYGVIVRNAAHDHYSASEPVLGEMDFSLITVFSARADGHPRMPEGYELYGFYCADSLYHSPKQLPPHDALLFKHFIRPDFLLAGITAACSNPDQQVPLYINTRDGAVLLFEAEGSTVEHITRALQETQGASPGYSLENVLSGASSLRDYLQGVATAGALSVVHASDCWGDIGRVSAQWQPYANVVARAWSPAFVDADTAARHVHQQIKQEEGRVFGGLICQRPDGLFTATAPVASYGETFDPALVYPAASRASMPAGYRVVAVYHTHRVQPLQLWRSAEEEQLYRNMLEPHELRAAIEERQWAQTRYFSAHDGALIKYTPSGSEREGRLLERITPRADQLQHPRKNALHMKLRANALKPSEYISQVARAGALQVLEGSVAWGEPGRVTSTWKVAVPTTAPAGPGNSVPATPE